jgi:hypothetical protein
MKLLSIFLTISILAMLILITPAHALDVKLSPMKKQDGNVSFTAKVNIKNGEQVPLTHMSITIGDQVCTFGLDGSNDCDNIDIQLTSFDSRYQQGNNRFKYLGQKFDYGYGYGYADSKADIEYNIIIDTTNLQGRYDVIFKAHTANDVFSSVKHKLVVN